MGNMETWNKLAKPPEWALKKIMAGRLKGKSDINPQWRYEAMTEEFGPCGFGWKYTIDKCWVEDGAHGCKVVFAQVSLYVKMQSEWSDAIVGIGGNQMVQIETAGLHSNDECYKMAVTDALSVACKMIGVGADVYKGLSDSKYANQPSGKPMQPAGNPNTTRPGEKSKPWLNEDMPAFKKAKDAIADGSKTVKDIRKVYAVSKKIAALLESNEPNNVEGPPPVEDSGLPL